MITRRSLIGSMGAILAAPAIIRVGSLMPVRSLAVGSRLEQVQALMALAEMDYRLLLPGLEWMTKYEEIPGQWATVFDRPSLPIA